MLKWRCRLTSTRDCSPSKRRFVCRFCSRRPMPRIYEHAHGCDTRPTTSASSCFCQPIAPPRHQHIILTTIISRHRDLQIQQSHGVDQYALMEAQSKHASDPEIQVLMGRLRMQFFGEEQMAELAEVEKAAPADMTSDKFYGVMKVSVGRCLALLIECCAVVRRCGISCFRVSADPTYVCPRNRPHVPTWPQKHMAVLEKAFRQALVETREVTPSATFDERVQYLEFLMAKRLEQIHEDALSEIGLSEEAFKGCMIKFGNDRCVTRVSFGRCVAPLSLHDRCARHVRSRQCSGFTRHLFAGVWLSWWSSLK